MTSKFSKFQWTVAIVVFYFTMQYSFISDYLELYPFLIL